MTVLLRCAFVRLPRIHHQAVLVRVSGRFHVSVPAELFARMCVISLIPLEVGWAATNPPLENLVSMCDDASAELRDIPYPQLTLARITFVATPVRITCFFYVVGLPVLQRRVDGAVRTAWNAVDEQGVRCGSTFFCLRRCDCVLHVGIVNELVPPAPPVGVKRPRFLSLGWFGMGSSLFLRSSKEYQVRQKCGYTAVCTSKKMRRSLCLC